MENACREFLRRLKHAEDSGTSTDLFLIAKQLNRMPAGATPLTVFDRCRQAGWVMGSSNGVWLTNEGRKIAAETH